MLRMSQWMNISFTTHTEALMTVFSLYEDMNAWTSSPEPLWESLHDHLSQVKSSHIYLYSAFHNTDLTVSLERNSSYHNKKKLWQIYYCWTVEWSYVNVLIITLEIIIIIKKLTVILLCSTKFDKFNLIKKSIQLMFYAFMWLPEKLKYTIQNFWKT